MRARFRHLRARFSHRRQRPAAAGRCGTDAGTGGASAGEPRRRPRPRPNELLVLEWSGYEAAGLLDRFRRGQPGDRRSTFEFGDTDANILGQMEAGSQADIFHFYTGWQQFYVDAGLVQEIDTSKLTNWDAVPDELQGARARSTASSTSSRGTGASPRSSTTPSRSPRSPAGTSSSTRSTPATSRCGMTAPAR